MKYKIWSPGMLAQKISQGEDANKQKAALNQIIKNRRIIKHLVEIEDHLIKNCLDNFSIESLKTDKEL